MVHNKKKKKKNEHAIIDLLAALQLIKLFCTVLVLKKLHISYVFLEEPTRSATKSKSGNRV